MSNNYLLVFHGASMPEGQEEGEKVMQAWTDWFGVLGDAVIDQGKAVGVEPGRELGPDGFSF